jgi:DNA-directed RNA polymerase subunit L
MKGERHTFPNLLRNALLKDSGVTFAAYKHSHPLDSNAIFVVKTSKGKTAKKAISDACKQITEDIEELQKAFKKAFK